jgi:itaconyl-CoA hydratase
MQGIDSQLAGTTLPLPKGRPDLYWEDLETGDVIQTAGMTITDAHLVQWAGLTGDLVSLHLDETYAATTPFGQRIAHGPLTMSLGLGLMTQTGYFSNVVAWLGLDEVRAVAPVFIGDTIRVNATVEMVRETKRPEQGIWKINYKVLKQDESTVMTFTSSFMIKRK